MIPLWIYDVIITPIEYEPAIPIRYNADGTENAIPYPLILVYESRGKFVQNQTGIITNPIEHLELYFTKGLLSDAYDATKRNVTQNYLPSPFRIKVEISKRREKGYKSDLAMISSPVSTVQCLGRVATLEQLYKDKLACLKDRAKAKDVLDMWYICQKLKRPYEPQDISTPEKDLVRDLRKYLPKDFWPVIDKLKS